jgi:c-di-GMP-binding flagellar brake protein YcgR
MNYSEGRKGSIEARRFPRYEIDAELNVATFSAGDQRVIRGRSLNISEVGMGGLFVTGWATGTAVTLKFPVPVVSTPLSVAAIVRSCSDHRYGFEFVELNPVQREIVSKTCRTLALLQ